MSYFSPREAATSLKCPACGKPMLIERSCREVCEAAREMRMRRTRNENVPRLISSFGTFSFLVRPHSKRYNMLIFKREKMPLD